MGGVIAMDITEVIDRTGDVTVDRTVTTVVVTNRGLPSVNVDLQRREVRNDLHGTDPM